MEESVPLLSVLVFMASWFKVLIKPQLQNAHGPVSAQSKFQLESHSRGQMWESQSSGTVAIAGCLVIGWLQ